MRHQDPILDVRDFRRSDLAYETADTGPGFRHNFDRDLHLVVVWPGARHKTNEILADLETRFLVRHASEIHWSKDHLSDNSSRLYKRQHTGTNAFPGKIGDGQFTAIVIEDPDPVYSFDRTVSGLIECVMSGW